MCSCGATNSAFNPACVACGRAIEESGDGEKQPGAADHAGAPIEQASAPLGLGSRVGAHELVALLGSGSLGRVFRGRDASGGAPDVAVKVLHPHLVAHEETRRRFLREARAMREVEHPSLGRIHDVVDAAGGLALVLELYEAPSLREVLREAPVLSAAHVRGIVRETALALGALHAAGWVHRDVKPENLVVLEPEARRSVRLLDFGLARSIEAGPEAVRTAAGVFVGSLAYASPEQLFGEDVGPATDWRSLGVMTFEMLTGRLPFRGKTKTELAREIQCAEIEPPDELDEDMRRLVRALMRRDAAARPKSARDVLALLGEPDDAR